MSLKKVACEVCGLADTRILHRHHIVPRCDSRCTNSPGNLAVLCPNDHGLVHAGEIVIVGVYPSTGGRCLVWYRKGDEPPFKKEYWLIKENPLVITLTGDEDDLPGESDG